MYMDKGLPVYRFPLFSWPSPIECCIVRLAEIVNVIYFRVGSVVISRFDEQNGDCTVFCESGSDSYPCQASAYLRFSVDQLLFL